MCSGVCGRCAPADVEPQSWWIRYTSIPPRAQMAAVGASRGAFPQRSPFRTDSRRSASLRRNKRVRVAIEKQ